VLAVVLLVVLLTPLSGWAQPKPGIPPIMPLREVKPGMRGIGRTVIHGQKIEDFNFEIIGLLYGSGGPVPVRTLMLFRASGPVIDESGGTAAGMSGSPMYIDGKLIGALSAGYLYQPGKRDLALATPIEEMLPVLDLPEGTSQAPWPSTFVASPPVRIGGRVAWRVVITDTLAHARQIDAAGLPGTTAFIPATFPVMVSGFSPRALQLVEQALRPAEPWLQYSGSPETFTAAPITAGSSVGVLQVRGDVNFGGICTVTLRVGDRLLICGHPWDQLGEVEYALTTSDIITVVRTLERPFKEANLGGLIGKIDQDRGPGIRGVLSRMPRMLTVRVLVTDQDTGKRVEKGVQLVRRRDVAKLFAAAMALTAVDRARDQSLGGGTASVKITMRAKGFPRALSRENVFYNSRDVALASLLDLPDALNFLLYNDLAPIEPIDVRIEIGLSTKRRTAAIIDASVEQREVAVGDRLRGRLMLRPYQEEAAPRTFELQVPRNFPRGPAVLVVGSAGRPTSSVDPQAPRMAQFLQGEPGPSPAATLQDAIQIFETFGKNTDILLQIVPFGLPPTGGEFLKFDVTASDIVHTDWVVQGDFLIPVLIR
jgi:hypothetical protein